MAESDDEASLGDAALGPHAAREAPMISAADAAMTAFNGLMLNFMLYLLLYC